jgi:DNA-binding NarL/FixJ family response regulator
MKRKPEINLKNLSQFSLVRSQNQKVPKIFEISYETEHTRFFSLVDAVDMQTVDFLPPDERVSLILQERQQNLKLNELQGSPLNRKLNNLIDQYAPCYPRDGEKIKSPWEESRKLHGKREEKEHRALGMIRSGYSNKIISSRLNLKYSQIAWIKRKLKYLPLTLNIHGRPPIIKQKYLEFVESHLSNKKNKFTSIYRIRALLCREFGLDLNLISTRTTERMIKMCSFKKKKCISQIYQRNTSENIERRYLDTVTFLNKVEGDTRFVFVDESGFNNQIIPIFGWARKGQRCVVRTFPQTHNTTVITAITQHDILGFQIFRGSVKGRDFGCFLMNLIEYYPDLLDERCLWIFDNASVHRAEVIKPLLNMLNIEYNTP